MGMTNRQTKVGKLNSGEFTEFAFALYAIAKQTNSNVSDVYASLSVIDGSVKGTYKGVSFYGDGKQLPPFMEFGYFLKGKSTKRVANWANKCSTFVDGYFIPDFTKVECVGGSSGKADVTFKKEDKVVKVFSLKWNHDAVERSQSPSWNSLTELYEKFVDISELKEYYEEKYDVFTIPGLRYSRDKCDWCPELIERGQIMQDTVQVVDKYVAEKFVSGDVNAQTLAKNLISCYAGQEDSVVFVELNSGKHYEIGANDQEKIEKALSDAEFTYKQEQTDSGRTRDTYIYLNGKEFIQFRTTASTDPASTAKGSNNDLRRIKRQTYLFINLPN